MKIAVIGDAHLGYAHLRLTQRFQDFASAFREAVEKALVNKADIVLIAGDLFNEDRPHSVARNQAIDALKLLKEAGVSVYAVYGNHDLVGFSPYGREGDLEALQKAGFLKVLQGSTVLGDELEIVGVNYMDERDEATRTAILNLKPVSNAKRKLLLLHQTLPDLYAIPADKGMVSASELAALGYDIVVCGHMHASKLVRINNTVILCTGSIQRYTTAETENKYMWLIDWSDARQPHIQPIPIENLRPVVYSVVNCTGMDKKTVEQKILDANPPEGALVRIVLEGALAENLDVPYLETVLKQRGALYVEIVNRTLRPLPATLTGTTAVELPALIRKVMKESGLSGECVERRTKLLLELLESVIDKQLSPGAAGKMLLEKLKP